MNEIATFNAQRSSKIEDGRPDSLLTGREMQCDRMYAGLGACICRMAARNIVGADLQTADYSFMESPTRMRSLNDKRMDKDRDDKMDIFGHTIEFTDLYKKSNNACKCISR